MVALKIRKVGNSVGVVLPKEVTSALKVHEGDLVYLTESPNGYHISPYDDEFARQMELAEKVLHEDRDILKVLAK